MVGMGSETLNTVKGHGFAVGDTIDFYGMGSDATPTEQGTPCVLTKQGSKYVLTYTATVKGDTITWEFGPAAKIWASKVETSSAEDRATAYAKRHHLTKDDAAFIASEIKTANPWGPCGPCDGTDAPMARKAHPCGLMGQSAPLAESAPIVSEHGFSGHSRRPMECRLCGKLAEVHATTTDEASSRHMWVKARTPLVTDHVKGWGARTANVLKAIAELGGSVDAWDLGSGRGWHKTAVRMILESGVLIRTNTGELAPTYTLSDMGRQACEWHGFKITETVQPVTVEEIEAAYAIVKQNGRVFVAEANNFVRPEAFVQAVSDQLLTLVEDGDMSRYVRTRRTADGVIITQGLPVWDNNLDAGTVDLTQIDSEGWFHVRTVKGGRSLMDAERVHTRHPFSRALASDVVHMPAPTVPLYDMGTPLAPVSDGEDYVPATVEIHTGDGTVITEGDVKARVREAFGPVGQVKAAAQPFSDRDMRDQIVAYLGSDVDGFYVDGMVDHLIKLHNGAINIDDVDAGTWHGTVAAFARPHITQEEVVNIREIASLPDCCNECEWDESLIWAGTDTMVKPSIRAALGRRKRKATRKARRMVKGGF